MAFAKIGLILALFCQKNCSFDDFLTPVSNLDLELVDSSRQFVRVIFADLAYNKAIIKR